MHTFTKLAIAVACAANFNAASAQTALAPPTSQHRPHVGCTAETPGLARSAPPRTWQNGVVYFEFDGNVSSQNRNRTYQAMDELMDTGAAVAFVPRTPGVNGDDYVHILSGSVNSSAVGRSGGRQDLNMFNWSFRFIIVHELLHAIGFWHEQARWDRDTFVTVNTGNIASGSSNNFNRAAIGDWITSSTAYDFESVMHYGECAFTNCDPCCPTITVNPPNQGQQGSIGQRDRLSVLDAQDVRNAYGTGVRARYLRPSGSGAGTLSNAYFSIRGMNNSVPSGSTVYAFGATYDDGNIIQEITEHVVIKPYGGVVTIR
jgi:hypothetical protein